MISRYIQESIARAADYINGRFPANVVFVFTAMIIGLLSGFGAFLLKYFINKISDFATKDLIINNWNFELLIFPLLGILITAAYQRFILKSDVSQGVEKLKRNLLNKSYNIKGNTTFSPILASSITIGFGGSAGAEGPIAYAGGAIGSNIAKYMKLSPDMMRLLIGCGAGAGIAGIFKSPLGGVLFTLEVLQIEMNTISIIALVSACLCSSLLVYVLTGLTLDVSYMQPALFNIESMPLIIILGLLCGVYSIYYSSMMKKTTDFLGKIDHNLIKNFTGGAILAFLIFVFPILYGEGYGTLIKMINGHHVEIVSDSIFYQYSNNEWIVLAVIFGVLMTKTFATATTNSSGGVGGDFTPTLFAGCLAGYLFSSCINMILDCDISTGNYAVIGMAGVMAGATRAPLMAIFITTEMTGATHLLLPTAIVAAISYSVVNYKKIIKMAKDANLTM